VPQNAAHTPEGRVTRKRGMGLAQMGQFRATPELFPLKQKMAPRRDIRVAMFTAWVSPNQNLNKKEMMT